MARSRSGGGPADAVREIAAMVPQAVPKSWEYRVAEEHRSTLDQIKAAFAAGQFGSRKSTAAKAIAAWLKSNGISTVGYQGVLEWLEK